MHYRGGLTYRHEKLTFLPSIFLEASTSTEKFLVDTVIRFQQKSERKNLHRDIIIMVPAGRLIHVEPPIIAVSPCEASLMPTK